MFSKKQTIILIILIFILIGGIFLYRQKYQSWPWRNSVNVPSPTATALPEVSTSQVTVPAGVREKMMVDIAAKISQLSPNKAVLGGKWFVDRFWYVSGSDEYVYAEYEDGHILRMILIKVAVKNDNFECKVEAYFEPGESDWLLKTGRDSQANKDLDLYEFDSNKSEWVKKTK